MPDLAMQQWRELFALWAEQYLARLRALQAATHARMAALLTERHRPSPTAPPLARRSRAATARIETIAREIAAIAGAQGSSAPPAACWVG